MASKYEETVAQMAEFNKKDKAAEIAGKEQVVTKKETQPLVKSIYNCAQEIIERMNNSRGKTSKSQYETMAYLRKLDRAGSPMDYIEEHCTLYRG